MILSISYECTQHEDQIMFSVDINDETVSEKFLDGQTHQVDYSFDNSDDPRAITVSLIMQGKTHEHTKINDTGNIVSDCAILIKSIIIDGIDVTDIFCQGKQCYKHDNNGTSDQFVDEFYGYIGCNGTVKFEFSVPMYRWFLEHC